ncbi:LytTR family DNA-binding domain-containing protein [Zavarzinia sp. CC-PAN008]|uniref:LytTR family DNA-binding domain-containing protein n=1 Tax=Zavarzinia sp. CC-PAN008 TaxID=3243332 RepID=UPI003F74902D
MRERMLPLRTEVPIALAVGVAAAFLGPFGTTEAMSLGMRLLYWPGVIVFGWSIMSLALQWVHQSRLLARHSMAVRLGVLIVLGSVPLSLSLCAINAVVFGHVPSLPGLALNYAQTALVTMLILVPMYLVTYREDPAPGDAVPVAPAAAPAQPGPAATETGPAPRPEPAFLRRLSPLHQGADLLALQMEDHYLRVHTGRGSDLILCRMADAVADLPEARGWRVHRSWWVAVDAISAVRWDKGRATLVLVNGLDVPVSRATLPSLRDRLRSLPEAPGQDRVAGAG